MISRIILLIVIMFALGGCMQTFNGSIPGGESKVFERPPWVVLGKTQYDQQWIDSQIEGGVAAYGWQRPGPRPEYLDRPVKARVNPPVKPKPGAWKRLKERVHVPWPKPRPQPAPVAEKPYVCTSGQAESGECLPLVEPRVVLPSPVVIVAPPPRSKLDELLDPHR